MRISSLLFLTLFVAGSTGAASQPTNKEIEEALTCQCGCGLTVHSCNHLQCGFAVPVKEEIAQQLSQGKAGQDILAAFVSRYGEKVLSAPTASGFNLAAWITPFLVVLVGGVFIGLVSLRWTKRQSQHEPALPAATEETERYRDRLKKELDTFDT